MNLKNIKIYLKTSYNFIITYIDANGDCSILIKTLNANCNTLIEDTVVLNHGSNNNVIINSDGNCSILTKNAVGYYE